MSLLPSLTELVARARMDLRVGLPVVLRDQDDGLLILAAETLTEVRMRAAMALGPAVLAVTARRAQTLKARIYDGDLARIHVPPEITLTWIKGLADPARDLATPMKGPLQTARDGGGDLHRIGVQLAKSAQLLPSVLAVEISDAGRFAADHGLTPLPAAAVAEDLLSYHPLLPVAAARVPMSVSEAGRVHVFRPEDGGVEHYAVEIGRPDRSQPVLARLHSACFTGDVLGSLKCDCGPQLHAALEAMGTRGEGILLYLNQEGRGIGLANKMRAYALQDQGFDTVEANHRLGFEDDERDFRIGADLLRRMGFEAVRLMTNNPRKVDMLQAEGLDVVERVPLKVGKTRFNAGYLAAKATKSGHFL